MIKIKYADGRGKTEDSREDQERKRPGRLQKSFRSRHEDFEISKTFPREELYSLSDQIRRSSRSVCVNISEAWRKRRYRAVFVNKLSDSGQASRDDVVSNEPHLPGRASKSAYA